MNKLIIKLHDLLFKLVQTLENDIVNINLKEKKQFTDLVSKLLPIILKIEKIQEFEQEIPLSEDDEKIINEFLNRKCGSERGI